jgi:hypothetical protein
MLPVRLILKGWAKKTQFIFPLDAKYFTGTNRYFSNKTAILLDSQNN